MWAATHTDRSRLPTADRYYGNATSQRADIEMFALAPCPLQLSRNCKRVVILATGPGHKALLCHEIKSISIAGSSFVRALAVAFMARLLQLFISINDTKARKKCKEIANDVRLSLNMHSNWYFLCMPAISKNRRSMY